MTIDINKVIDAAKVGGEIVKKYFGEALEIEEKTSAGDLRTKADVESEMAILNSLKTNFQSFNIYAEESGKVEKNSEYTFVIDPLDGTNNFVLGIPDFAISVGLLKGEEVVMGVVYNPILGQLYTAEKNSGAFLNGKRIRVNSETDITKSTVSYVCGYNTSREYSEDVVKKLKDVNIKRLIDHWAPAYDYCLLASGRIEVVIAKEDDLEDFVAAKIIVAEAGAKVTDFDGGESKGTDRSFIMTNGTKLHQQILEVLK